MELTLDKEFHSIIPPLSEDEYIQLEKNILEDGIRDPLVIWNDTIIDGHNRYGIAQKHGLKYKTTSKDFDNKQSVIEWIIRNQFGRRNITLYQRSLLALRLKPIIREQAKEKQVAGGKDKVPQKSVEAPVDTQKELAKSAGVSHDTIAKVETIEKSATPEIKQKLASGDLSINEVYKEIKKEEIKIKRESDIEEIKINISKPNISGLYDILVIDPPWQYGADYDSETRRVSSPYPEMSIEQIKNIKIPANKDSIMWLWTTHKFLWDAKDILDFWGFDFKAMMVWDKEKMGIGYWLRMQCEFCLLATKGKPIWDAKSIRDIIREPRREHSRKPETFFNMINENLIGRKLDYFGREKREGWDIYGAESDKF